MSTQEMSEENRANTAAAIVLADFPDVIELAGFLAGAENTPVLGLEPMQMQAENSENNGGGAAANVTQSDYGNRVNLPQLEHQRSFVVVGGSSYFYDYHPTMSSKVE